MLSFPNVLFVFLLTLFSSCFSCAPVHFSPVCFFFFFFDFWKAVNQVCSCSPFSFCFCLFAIRYTVLPRASFYCCRFFFSFPFFFFGIVFVIFGQEHPFAFKRLAFSICLFVCLIQSFCLFCRILCFFFLSRFLTVFSLQRHLFSLFVVVVVWFRCCCYFALFFSAAYSKRSHLINLRIFTYFHFSFICFFRLFFLWFFFIYILACFCCCSLVFISL